MGSNTEDLKGRAKEAVGDLTDNADLQREGQADRASSKAKEAIDSLAELAKDLVDDIDRAGGKAREAIDSLAEKAKNLVDDIKGKVQGSDED